MSKIKKVYASNVSSYAIKIEILKKMKQNKHTQNNNTMTPNPRA